MKLYTFLLILLIVSFQHISLSQSFVNTQPTNKNAILEEFTGIHCGYCPDGHRIANELAKQYEGRVFLINIHAGSFANPSAGEVDLRTDDGAAIDAAAQVSGYPAGSVNRSTNPWAQNRGSWANIIKNIIAQPSPVNVAVKAYVDFKTRELVAEVEYYYTSDVEGPNYLTVMLLENNIIGTQSDYGNYNPTNWNQNKQYRHHHALRKVISEGGSFGQVIQKTKKGDWQYLKFTYPVPEYFKNTPSKLFNLEVVAFIAQSQGNIYTGSGTKVEFDKSYYIDLAIKDLTIYPKNYCFESISPILEITNNSNMDINSFEIGFKSDAINQTKKFEGKLSKGEKTIFEWGNLPFTVRGSYESYLYGFEKINNDPKIEDMNWTNDISYNSGFGFKKKAVKEFYGGFDGILPNNFAFDKSQNQSFNMINGNQTTKYGALNTTGAVRYPLHESWGLAGKPGHILFGEVEISALLNPILEYYYAYSADVYGGTKPVVKVSVSEDCGENWIEIHSLTCEETGKPATSGNWYVPNTTDYKLIQVPLSQFKSKDLLIRVSGIAGTHGNALYIDEIKVSSLTSIDELDNTDFSVYPNPAIDFIKIQDNFNGKQFKIYDILGNLVSSGILTENMIFIGNLSQGLYNIVIDNKIYKFVKN